ncbi:LacI family DNA-binding transcriptional regulator [Xylanimonas allomyrinae]|uniref:LacI family DNA-binding transcriptional regulator n=1 Tax=Xylanimonas allomyrinae TaxID=2509459 RepID=UPI001FE2C14E|nr:LacI family DNA-binding transcriptional regulator [Xylanimonas allomyrinae]
MLNHADRVRPATLAKVTRAIEALDYQPNANARTLAAGSSRLTGLILPDLGNSFFVDVARGAEAAAEEAGHVLMIAHSDGRLEREQRYLKAFDEERASGVLLGLNDDDHFTALLGSLGRRLPTVSVNLSVPSALSCSVSADNEHGAYLATCHLAGLGRQRLAFVGGPLGLRPIRHRAAGFDRAVKEHAIEHVRTVDPAGVSRADGWSAGQELADDARAGRIDGIVASTDLLAVGVVQALQMAGVAIPGDIAIVGYDNNQATWNSPVAITTVQQPGEAIGRVAMRLLLKEIADGSTHAHETAILEPTLVVRASTVG